MNNKQVNYKQTEIGEVPKDWQVEPVSRASEIISGGTPKTSKAEYWGGKIPWLSVADFNNEQRYVYDSEKTITEKGLNGSSTNILKKEMLIISARGTVGVLAQVGRDMAFNQSCYGLNSKQGYINDFLYYSLKSRMGAIRQKTHGSVFSTITKRTFDDIFLPKPKVEEQQQIASVLSSLDDKIELNRKMNQTLEEMGKALFKNWFVDFEFPNNEGKPYKSSGGKMVESELGEIPKGWDVAQLKEFGEIVCGKTPPKKKSEYFGGNVPFIKIPDMHSQMFIVKTEDSLTKEGMDFQKQKNLLKDSICVSCIATVGLVCITSQVSQTNQQINSIVPSERFYREYLYFTLSSMDRTLRDYASGGSATLNLNTGSFSKIYILKPSKETLQLFNEHNSNLFEKVLMNEKENINLAQARDSLLPRLMSGRLRVN